jgi:hypothetical protein
VQQLQQIKQQLQAPQWKDVLALLRDDLQRAYRIDIETNSTVEPEAAEDQQQIQEVLATLSQVLQGISPLVVKGVLPFEAAQVLLLTIIRRFRFGSELEDTIKAMQPPKPEDDGHAAEVAQLQQQMAAQQMQAQQQTAQQELQVKSMAADKAVMEKNLDLQLRELQLKADQEALARNKQAFEQHATMREQFHAAKLSPEAQSLEMRKIQAERETEKMKMAVQKDTELQKAMIDKDAKIEVARIAAQAQKEKPAPVAA